MSTGTKEEKPFSESVRALLIYTKSRDIELSYTEVQKVLGKVYHPEMTMDDIIVVLCSATRELALNPKFETPSITYIIPKIIKAPIEGTSTLGGNKLFGPKKDDKFTVEEFYNSMIVQLLNVFRFSRVDWCAEYLHPELTVMSTYVDHSKASS